MMGTHTSIMDKVSAGLPLDDLEIVDAHGHMGPYYNFHIQDNDAKSMIATMDRLGIRTICVSAHASVTADPRLGNDMVSQAMRDFPGRFVGYAGVNPNYPKDVEPELSHAFQNGHTMIKLHPSCHDYAVTGPNYGPVWEYAKEYQCPVLIHCWQGDARCEPATCAKVAQDHPDVVIILGHSGGPSGIDEGIAEAQKWDHFYLDITGSTNTIGLIEKMVEGVGADRVLYGSDLPFIDASSAIGKVAYSKISEEDELKILGKNMRQLIPRNIHNKEEVGI